MPQIVIDLTNQQATRLADAWQVVHGAIPTLADVKALFISELKAVVRAGERRAAERAIPEIPFDPT